MSISKIACPCCGVTLKAAGPFPPGKKIKCPKCAAVFAVEPEQPPAPPQRPASRAPTVSTNKDTKKSEPLASKKSRTQARPASARRREEPDDDSERDWEEEPGPRRTAKQTKEKGGHLLLIGGICAGVLFLVGFSIAGAWAVVRYMAGSSKPGELVLPKSFQNPRVQAAFDDWLQDPEAAKREAAQGNKDLLLLFEQSDSPASVGFTDQVLSQPAFRDLIRQQFVLVIVDFPFSQGPRAKVQDRVRNERLHKEYRVIAYPTLILADREGKPYTVAGWEGVAAGGYAQQLIALRERRNKRDELLTNFEKGQSPAKLAAAKELLKLFQENHVLIYYQAMLEDWTKLARAQDPKNEQGSLELFFEADWLARLRGANPKDGQELAKTLAGLDEWKKTFKFKDADRAASLHLEAGTAMAATGKPEVAAKYFLDGLAYKPGTELRQKLSYAAATLFRGSGTGFVVAPGGYVLTNFHVAGGPGRVLVRLSGTKESLPAEVVAHDEKRDIALLRVKGPAGLEFKALSVAAVHPLGRGDQVAVLGYPLGDMVGSGMKLTTGVVSATPEALSGDMLVLDAKVNPGNSGGPLCDSSGNVVGMITAKSFGGGTIDSYGMAIPAQDLEAFLMKNLKGYKPSSIEQTRMAWNEVDRKVNASVLMVLKTH